MKRRIAYTMAAWIAGAAFASAESPPLITVGPIDGTPVVSLPPAPPPPPPATSASPVSNITAPVVATDCGTDAGSGRWGRVYGSIDYLLFNFRDGPAPALIQHLPTPAFQANPPDANQAITIFGDGIRQHAFSGFRIFGGVAVNDTWAVEGSYSQFETKNKSFFIQSNGDPSIGRYYIDLTNNQRPITYLIYSQPDGATNGYININAPVKMYTFDVNARTAGNSVFADRFDWLVGFRYLDLRDGIFIEDFTEAPATGQSFRGQDNFAAKNQFYGAQIGGNSFANLGCGFTLDTTLKVAFGGVRQRVIIDGFTEERLNGVVTRRVPGDVLTQPTNIGEYSRGYFAVVPELLVKLGYQVGSRVNVSIGYNLIAVSNVVRAGSAIDAGINPNVNPFLAPSSNSTAARPGFAFNGTDFWAQGLTLGVGLNY